MMNWRVSLSGDPFDLQTLADLEFGVTKDGDAFVLRSDRFDGLTDANKVREAATLLVELLNGAARISSGDFDQVGIGAVIGDRGDGTHDVHVGATLTARGRMRANVVDAATGQPVTNSAPPTLAKKSVTLSDLIMLQT